MLSLSLLSSAAPFMARGSDLKIYQISTVIRRMMSTVMLLKGTSFSELSMRMLMRAFWGLQRGRYKITTQRKRL